jgi:ATP-dependent RNA/DNA helicase IGHMBP2
MNAQVTYKRLRETLLTLQKAGSGQHPGGGNLPDVLFGLAQPRFLNNPPSWKPLNKSLDSSQLQAVDKALAAQDVALIHGPPGTGKTTAVVELILQEVARGNKVLPSSDAYLNMGEGRRMWRTEALERLNPGC